MMKKVIAVLCAIVVLILGTAIGVATSASHLSEKGLLSAGDVQLALASQGLLAIPDWGDHSSLVISGVTPKVYRVDKKDVLVYEFADAMQRENAEKPLPLSWDMTTGSQYIALGSWRNLYVTIRNQVELVQVASDEASEMREITRILRARERAAMKYERLRNALLYMLNDVQQRTFQIETGQMIYTLEQISYSMPTPTPYGNGRLYDNWAQCQLVDCQYKEQPPAKELPVSAALRLTTESREPFMSWVDSWNGQGAYAQRDIQVTIQELEPEPGVVIYHIHFEHGSIFDNVKCYSDMGGV